MILMSPVSLELWLGENPRTSCACASEAGALSDAGYPVQWGSSYIQTVTFDERGPVAEAIMVYGQSSEPGSPYSFDQLEMYAEKEWMPLPFHPDDVAGARIGEVLRLAIE